MNDLGEGAKRRGRRFAVVPLLFGLTAAAMVGCGSESSDDTDETTTTAAAEGPGTAPLEATALDGRTFLSTSVTGQDLVADSVIRLSFEGTIMAVNGGCNTMTSEFAVDESGYLAWTGEPAATMMACEEDLAAQDIWLTELLTGGAEATLEDATLTLATDGVTVELAEEADESVLGTTWTLDGIIEGDAVSSLPAGVEAPTLDLAEDGTVGVFTGCNTGGTTVAVGEGTLTFDPMRLTMMACEGDTGTVEAAVVAVLDGETEMVVDGKTLTLTKGDQGLLFRAP